MTTFSYGLANVVDIVSLALKVAVLLAGVYTIYHCARSREDAYRATDKWQKKYWLAALIGCVVLIVAPLGMFGLVIGAVGIILYLVDVRPKVNEVQHRRY